MCDIRAQQICICGLKFAMTRFEQDHVGEIRLKGDTHSLGEIELSHFECSQGVTRNNRDNLALVPTAVYSVSLHFVLTNLIVNLIRSTELLDLCKLSFEATGEISN